MKKHIVTVATTVLGLLSVHSAVAEGDNGVPAQTQAFYQFLGSWHGDAQMTETGKEPVNLKMKINCRKTSAGFGISCDDTASNPQMTMVETDLMGFNPADGTHHWYAITNMGEVHDHLVTWESDKVMKASASWEQDGTPMQETITVTWTGSKAMEFHTVVTAGEQQVALFTGKFNK